jgi:hypothetical protein
MTLLTTVEKVKPQLVLPTEKVNSSNLIEPTEAMIKQVLQMYLDGASIWDIRVTIKKKDTNLKLSESQITEIIETYKSTLVIEEPKEITEETK